MGFVALACGDDGRLPGAAARGGRGGGKLDGGVVLVAAGDEIPVNRASD